MPKQHGRLLIWEEITFGIIAKIGTGRKPMKTPLRLPRFHLISQVEAQIAEGVMARCFEVDFRQAH